MNETLKTRKLKHRRDDCGKKYDSLYFPSLTISQRMGICKMKTFNLISPANLFLCSRYAFALELTVQWMLSLLRVRPETCYSATFSFLCFQMQ